MVKRKKKIGVVRMPTTASDYGALMLAVEFGFRQCEKGHNLSRALSEAGKLLAKPAPQGVSVVSLDEAGDSAMVTLQRTPLVRLQCRLVRAHKRGLELSVMPLDGTRIVMRPDIGGMGGALLDAE